MAAAQPGPRFSGWWQPPSTSSSGTGRAATLEYYVNGVKVGTAQSGTHAITGALTTTTSVSATTTVTAGTDLASTAGHVLVPAGDVKLGTATAFASTQPVAAVVMGGTSKGGTAPAGAIATCGGVFASDTVVKKIIADGTVSNVET